MADIYGCGANVPGYLRPAELAGNAELRYGVINCLRSGNMGECTVPVGTVYCCINGRERTETAVPGRTRMTPGSGAQQAYADTRNDRTRSATR